MCLPIGIRRPLTGGFGVFFGSVFGRPLNLLLKIEASFHLPLPLTLDLKKLGSYAAPPVPLFTFPSQQDFSRAGPPLLSDVRYPKIPILNASPSPPPPLAYPTIRACILSVSGVFPYPPSQQDFSFFPRVSRCFSEVLTHFFFVFHTLFFYRIVPPPALRPHRP